MTPEALLAEVIARGVDLWAEDAELCLRAPKGALTPDLREQLTRHKPALLTILGDRRRHTAASFSQRRLWFFDQFEPNSPAYNMHLVYRLSGTLDRQALERSLNEIVRRHETLRTSFTAFEGQPVQVIEPSLDFKPTHMSDEQGNGAENRLRDLVSTFVRAPFDLTRSPLMRVALIRVNARQHVFVLVTHHIVSDGLSQRILLREFVRNYSAMSQGRAPDLDPLPLQYANYVRLQRGGMAGALDKQLAYWRDQLAGPPPPIDLPMDHPRPPVQTFNGDREVLHLSPALTAALQSTGRSEGATLFMVLLAAFQTLLYRYTGLEDIAVGSPVAGRNYPGTENLIGFFVNNLVFRGDLSGNPTFRELVRRTRALVWQGMEHQDLPFEKLVEDLQPGRDLTRSPLFQIAFSMLNAGAGQIELPGLVLERMSRAEPGSKFDLTLFGIAREDGIQLTFVYNTDLFDASTIARMTRHMLSLLERFAADPDLRLNQPCLLSDEEQRLILHEFNRTAASFPERATLSELFERRVASDPDAVAARFHRTSLTYAELNARANRLAQALLRHGVTRGAIVAVAFDRSLEMLSALLAVLKAGAAYLPLDPSYPAERLAFMLQDSGAGLLLTHSGVLPQLPRQEALPIVEVDRADLGGLSCENLATAASASDLAYVIYTSGSTGRPKGTLLEHRGACNLCQLLPKALGLTPGVAVLQFASIGFDASVWEIFPSLAAGATLILADQSTLSDPASLTQLIRDEHVTAATLPPSMLTLLCPEDVPGLRVVVSAGERCPVQLAHRWSRGRRFINAYGPTETTVCAILYECSGDEAGTVPIGRPIANTQVYVLDPEMRPLPLGVPGDLYVGGAGLARGYLNRPDLTAERFVSNPFSTAPGARLYKTGDRARFRSDGALEFLGRTDGQVKLRGHRIEPGEIENALREHPEIRDAAVVLRPDPSGDPRLVGYVAVESLPSFDAERLRAYLAAHLPAYMVPSTLVALERLPLTPNGKIDVAALPQPVNSSACLTDEDMPRGPIEEVVAGIWCDVLSVTQAGRRQNFFELGGHSLKATQVVSRLRDAFNVDLPVRTLFENPTVAGLAVCVEAARLQGTDRPGSPLEIVPRDGELPLSYAQQRLWFLDRLGARDGVYTISSAVRLRGPLDVPALEYALNEIVRRHESLRTNFERVDGRPRQVVRHELLLKLGPRDLLGLDSACREPEAVRIAREEALRPFDLAAGPLIRALLLRLGSDDHVMVVSMHHAVSDGWSMGIFTRELSALYSSRISGKPADLPGLPVQYPDFAVWQRRWLQGDNLQRQLDYWKRHLQGAPPALDLPTDRPRPAVQTFHGGRESLRIPMGLTQDLQSLSHREGVTSFMTLCAAFNVLLHRYTGQEDVVVGTPIANRTRVEIEGLIGFFVNTLALRFQFEANTSFRSLLHHVRDVALGAYAHQDLPFEKLVEEIAPERDLARTPLFQVMFALQNTGVALPQLDGLQVSRMPTPGQKSRFELSLTLGESRDGLNLAAEYNSDLFDAATIQRMLGHYVVLLQGIALDVQCPVGMLPLLTANERQTMLIAWNETHREVPSDRCVHELVELQAAQRPEAVALVDDQEALSYGELNRRANRLAHRLIGLGVVPESRVAICLNRRLPTVTGFLGILKAGGAYVPLDATYPDERLRFMIADSGAQALVTERALAQRFGDRPAHVVFLDDDPAIPEGVDSNPAVTMNGRNLAYAVYTSGSTGQPKGVLIEHWSLLNLIYWHRRAFAVTGNDRATHLAGPAFDASVWELWPYLTAGATVHIPSEATRVSAVHLRDWLVERAITVTFLPTPLAEQAVLLEWPQPCSLRVLLTGGDTLHTFPPGSLPFDLVNNYGPTEYTVVTTSGRVEPGADCLTKPSLGRPIDNTEVYILDPRFQPVPIGVPGELYIGGAGLARGYLNRPELTDESFISPPFPTEGGARLYKTGDLARYRADGSIEFLGRSDRQVKIRGYRIELGEIESVLRRCPGVGEAVVLAELKSPGGPALAAFVVPAPGADVTVERIHPHLKNALPAHMLPARVMLTGAIPYSAHGKVDRDALFASAPGERPSRDGTVAPPSTETEKTIASIWLELLGREAIGIDDNFLDCGGHSMLAVELLTRMNDAFRLDLPLRLVFEEPTVRGLARRVDDILPVGGQSTTDAGSRRVAPGESSPFSDLVVPIRLTGTRRPIFLVAPAGGTVFAYYALAHHLGASQPVFALQDPAYEGKRTPCTTVEEMAACYIQAIRTVQPRGPYLIGGWSFGGTVAFEMARQLQGEASLLFLIETITGHRANGKARPRFAERMQLFRENFGVRLSFAASGMKTAAEGAWYSLAATPVGKGLTQITRRVRSVMDSRQRRVLRQNLERAMNASATGRPGAGALMMRQSLARHWLGIALANTRAFRSYTPEPYAGAITLFLGERRASARQNGDPTRGWSRLAQAGVDVRTLPGDHFSILRNPHVAGFAKDLRNCADAVEPDRKAQPFAPLKQEEAAPVS